MSTIANFSLLDAAEQFTYALSVSEKPAISEVVSRLAALILLSPAAALDIGFHSLALLPTFFYAVGRSCYYKQEADFTIPWQLLQRIRNSVAALFLGSPLGVLHPYAGLIVSEPTDKHTVIGILSSNIQKKFTTPCSPIDSLGLIERLAKNHRYAEEMGIQREIFPPEYRKIIREIKAFETVLEPLQAQEFIHKITNVTLFVMAQIKGDIENSSMAALAKEFLVRLSGVLVPILTVIDVTIITLAQVFFLGTGIIRMISGRGPIYTEVTSNPLMHLAFLMQNALKLLGNLIGTFIWFISPMSGFKASLYPANLFFKMQLNLLLLWIRIKMERMGESDCFVLPVGYAAGECSALSFPTHSMHKSYLIVEKKNGTFNLHWIDRPHVKLRTELSEKEAEEQIRVLLHERFPFMDIEKLMDYPITCEIPSFDPHKSYDIKDQGNETNCVVSNFFETLRVLDTIQGREAISNLRCSTVRKSLVKDYSFYKDSFSPFESRCPNFYGLTFVWEWMEQLSEAEI